MNKVIVKEFDRDITVYPIADVHLGALEHQSKEWSAFCRAIEQDPNAYVILVGDLVNNSVRNSISNPFTETMRPMEQKRRMTEYLAPITDKILCAVGGNHEYRTVRDSDEDITRDILSKLNVEDLYREDMAFLKIVLKKEGMKPHAFAGVITHGAGGSINKTNSFGSLVEGADFMVTGHTHKGSVMKPSKLVFDMRNNVVVQKSWVNVVAESWLSYGGYAARKLLVPHESGCPQKLLFSGDTHCKKLEVLW